MVLVCDGQAHVNWKHVTPLIDGYQKRAGNPLSRRNPISSKNPKNKKNTKVRESWQSTEISPREGRQSGLQEKRKDQLF